MAFGSESDGKGPSEEEAEAKEKGKGNERKEQESSSSSSSSSPQAQEQARAQDPLTFRPSVDNPERLYAFLREVVHRYNSLKKRSTTTTTTTTSTSSCSNDYGSLTIGATANAQSGTINDFHRSHKTCTADTDMASSVPLVDKKPSAASASKAVDTNSREKSEATTVSNRNYKRTKLKRPAEPKADHQEEIARKSLTEKSGTTCVSLSPLKSSLKSPPKKMSLLKSPPPTNHQKKASPSPRRKRRKKVPANSSSSCLKKDDDHDGHDDHDEKDEQQQVLDEDTLARIERVRGLAGIDPYAPDPELNTPPGETGDERRKRLERINGRRKRAKKFIEIDQYHRQITDLAKNNRRLRMENKAFRERIDLIQSMLKEGKTPSNELCCLPTPLELRIHGQKSTSIVEAKGPEKPQNPEVSSQPQLWQAKNEHVPSVASVPQNQNNDNRQRDQPPTFIGLPTPSSEVYNAAISEFLRRDVNNIGTAFNIIGTAFHQHNYNFAAAPTSPNVWDQQLQLHSSSAGAFMSNAGAMLLRYHLALEQAQAQAQAGSQQQNNPYNHWPRDQQQQHLSSLWHQHQPMQQRQQSEPTTSTSYSMTSTNYNNVFRNNPPQPTSDIASHQVLQGNMALPPGMDMSQVLELLAALEREQQRHQQQQPDGARRT